MKQASPARHPPPPWLSSILDHMLSVLEDQDAVPAPGHAAGHPLQDGLTCVFTGEHACRPHASTAECAPPDAYAMCTWPVLASLACQNVCLYVGTKFCCVQGWGSCCPSCRARAATKLSNARARPLLDRPLSKVLTKCSAKHIRIQSVPFFLFENYFLMHKHDHHVLMVF